MIRLTKHIFGPLDIPANRLVGVFGPQSPEGRGLSDDQIAERLADPIDTPSIADLAKGKSSALVVTDDNTRLTPLKRILPPILNQLESAGIESQKIKILIGLGTHRPMTQDEIMEKFGEALVSKYQILNHDWANPDQLGSMGASDLGFEVIINRLVRETDLIFSVGSIVPHATAGFSGGGKTIMPGICGEKTIEDTHWAALDYEMAAILGMSDNKVRRSIVGICRKVGLDMIINAVLFDGDRLFDLVAGDVETAHRKGMDLSRQVYGVVIPEKADIVIAEAYPTDIDLRQAIKAICAADLVCKDGGVIILPAECPEGIAPQFPEFERYGFNDPDALFDRVEAGKFKDKLLAYTLVAIGRIISKRVRAILVSPGITENQASRLGFSAWACDLQQAYHQAMDMTHGNASIAVLNQAGEMLPVFPKEK
jgi:lactate racemase